MIHEVDFALRGLIQREIGTRDVEIVFDAPTRDWAGRRNAPTIDLYLYDIREDLRRRSRGMVDGYDEQAHVVTRRLPPRYFRLSYLVTAWTQRPEDEHRLLSALLSCLLGFEAVPTDLLTGPLLELGESIPMTVALPPPEDRSFADVWSALGGELKPSLDVVATVPIVTGQGYETGPPVQHPPLISVGGSRGWPGVETVQRRAVGGGGGEAGPPAPEESAPRPAGGVNRTVPAVPRPRAPRTPRTKSP